jgi:UV excision repair protein RAD23
MKLAIKTLKGELFHVEGDVTDQISAIKQKIESSKPDFAADRQKLIFTGKVLKDEQTIQEIGISESDFIVCMMTKEVKPAAPAPAPTPAATSAPAAPIVPPTTATTTPAPPSPSPTPSPAAVEIPQELVDSLVSMGFPEGECRAALTAANGNPNLAYDFLMNGIPDSVAPPQQAAPSGGGGVTVLDELRQHPQFNSLKQLVQTDPGQLAQVLNIIGQQNPALLEAIHANNDAFVNMMNEPIVDTPPPAQRGYSPAAVMPPQAAGGQGRGPEAAQMMQMLASIPAAQRGQFAQSLGMTPEQLEQFMSMMASLPPGELENMMNSMGAGGGGGGGGGMGGMGGAPPPGANVIRFTEEEMAAVNNLVALGFTPQQAAQAYISCDKNEELAANLLFDGAFADDDGGDGGFGGGDDMYN